MSQRMLDEAEMPSPGTLQVTENGTASAGDDYVSSRDALRILDVKPQTLYSYVSRGLIRRRVKPGHRTSYYNREDINRLKSRSVARSGHGPAAASAMYWGEPVLETAITEITPDGPRYRERLAMDLARDNRSFESVAEYLWTGTWPSSDNTWANVVVPAALASEFGKIGPADFRYVLTQSIVLLAKTWSCDPGLREQPCPATTVLGVMAGAWATPVAAQFGPPPPPADPNAPVPKLANGKPDLSGSWQGAGGGQQGSGGDMFRRCTPFQTKNCMEWTNQSEDWVFMSATRLDERQPLYKPEHWDKMIELDQWTNKYDPVMTCLRF